MAKGEKISKTSPAEIENLIEQIKQANLDQSTKDKVERLLRTVLMLVSLLQRKNISIRKLKEMVFGPRTEKWRGTEGGEEKQTDGEEKAEEGGVKEERGSTESREKTVTRGHGRRAAGGGELYGSEKGEMPARGIPGRRQVSGSVMQRTAIRSERAEGIDSIHWRAPDQDDAK